MVKYGMRVRWLLFLLLFLLIGIVWMERNFVPVWDGWVFLQCYQHAARIGALLCDGHPSIVPMSVFGAVQLLFPGRVAVTHLTTGLLVCIGIVVFRKLLQTLFRDRLSAGELDLIAMLFGFNPVVVAHIIQPNLDLIMTVLFIVLLYALRTGRRGVVVGVGLAMVFTKETGILLYAVSMGTYGILAVLRGRRADTAQTARLIWYLVPPGIFLLFMALFPPFRNLQVAPVSWQHILVRALTVPPVNAFVAAQLLSGLVINFTWIMGLVLAVRISGWIRAKKTWRTLRDWVAAVGATDPRVYYYLLFAPLLVVLTRIPFYNNPRYMLPVLPVYIILFADALPAVIRRAGNRLVVVCILLVLTIVSLYRTIDPVAILAFGSYRFGRHEVLKMSRYTDPQYGFGKDEGVYNLQFTQYAYLTEAVVAAYGLDAVYVAHTHFTWWNSLGFVDYSSFAPDTLRRTASVHSYPVVFLSPEQAITSSAGEILFLEYPNMRNEEAVNQLLPAFAAADSRRFERSGYSVNVIRMTRRQ